ncbi:fruR/shl operon leader peptide [Escherichia coli]|nr:fruR/shl operon leader peptide [Escherichia coli]
MRNLQPNMSRWAFFAKSVGTWNKRVSGISG